MKKLKGLLSVKEQDTTLWYTCPPTVTRGHQNHTQGAAPFYLFALAAMFTHFPFLLNTLFVFILSFPFLSPLSPFPFSLLPSFPHSEVSAGIAVASPRPQHTHTHTHTDTYTFLFLVITQYDVWIRYCP